MPVVITGLTNASELNGKFGHVLGFDECSGRYKIDVIDVGHKRIKRVNLSIDDDFGSDEEEKDDFDE